MKYTNWLGNAYLERPDWHVFLVVLGTAGCGGNDGNRENDGWMCAKCLRGSNQQSGDEAMLKEKEVSGMTS